MKPLKWQSAVSIRGNFLIFPRRSVTINSDYEIANALVAYRMYKLADSKCIFYYLSASLVAKCTQEPFQVDGMVFPHFLEWFNAIRKPTLCHIRTLKVQLSL